MKANTHEIIVKGNSDDAKLEFLLNVEAGMRLKSGCQFMSEADIANLATSMGMELVFRDGGYFVSILNNSKVAFALMALLTAARRRRDEAQKEIDKIEAALKKI
jgi:intergrase/recombinase